MAKTGWYVSEKNPQREMTATQVESDLQWWEAHIYRTVHRLAMQDPLLTTAMARMGVCSSGTATARS